MKNHRRGRRQKRMAAATVFSDIKKIRIDWRGLGAPIAGGPLLGRNDWRGLGAPIAGGPFFFFPEKKKGRQRPTLARAGPALPLAMRRLTSVFGMGTGISASLWPPA